ncbi:MAG: hypothetical protein QOF24_34 [Verrucomicrobiota bacterium]
MERVLAKLAAEQSMLWRRQPVHPRSGRFRGDFLLAALLGKRETLSLLPAGRAFPDVISALAVSHKNVTSPFPSRYPSCFASPVTAFQINGQEADLCASVTRILWPNQITLARNAAKNLRSKRKRKRRSDENWRTLPGPPTPSRRPTRTSNLKSLPCRAFLLKRRGFLIPVHLLVQALGAHAVNPGQVHVENDLPFADFVNQILESNDRCGNFFSNHRGTRGSLADWGRRRRCVPKFNLGRRKPEQASGAHERSRTSTGFPIRS